MAEPSRIEQLERENAALRDRLAASDAASAAAAVTRLLSDRTVLENLPDVVSVTDRNHCLLYLNRVIPTRRVEDIVGTNALDYIPSDQLEIYKRAFELAWASGETQRIEVRSISDFHWETRLVPLKDDGKVVYMMCTSADITERKRLEEQLREAHKMEAIGRLTAGIAHNFNNMLSVIIPNVSLCRSDLPSESELAPRLADVEHAAKQAAEMVRQLMLFARGQRDVPKGSLDLIAIARRTLEICRTTFDRRITIELELCEPLPRASFVASQFEQVLLNICINARDAFVQAKTEAPRIDIRIDRSPLGHLRITIADNGPGMDEAIRSRIFEPFFTTKDIGRGVGLGLSTVYAIVKEHHGLIRCDSQLGQGTRFEIELPVAALGPSIAPVVAPVLSPAAPATVLVIDDEPLVRRALRALLERGGYRVIDCDGGRAAFELLDAGKESVDAILLDRSMPGMSGDQVLAKLIERGLRIPVALLSGQVSDPADHPHAAAVLAKPVDRALLIETIRSLVTK